MACEEGCSCDSSALADDVYRRSKVATYYPPGASAQAAAGGAQALLRDDEMEIWRVMVELGLGSESTGDPAVQASVFKKLLDLLKKLFGGGGGGGGTRHDTPCEFACGDTTLSVSCPPGQDCCGNCATGFVACYGPADQFPEGCAGLGGGPTGGGTQPGEIQHL